MSNAMVIQINYNKTKVNFVHLFKVLEHGMAIADLDDEQELIQTQQDTRSTSLSTSDMCDLENKSEVWHRIHVCQHITIQCARIHVIHCVPTTFKFSSPASIMKCVTPDNTVCIETTCTCSLDFRIPSQMN